MLHLMDQGYLVARRCNLNLEDLNFQRDYQRLRKLYGGNGRLPEATLLMLAERQLVRQERAALENGHDKVLEKTKAKAV